MENYNVNDKVFVYDFASNDIYEGVIIDTESIQVKSENKQHYFINVTWQDSNITREQNLAYRQSEDYFESYKNERLFTNYLVHHDKNKLIKCIYNKLLEDLDFISNRLYKIKEF